MCTCCASPPFQLLWHCLLALQSSLCWFIASPASSCWRIKAAGRRARPICPAFPPVASSLVGGMRPWEHSAPHARTTCICTRLFHLRGTRGLMTMTRPLAMTLTVPRSVPGVVTLAAVLWPCLSTTVFTHTPLRAPLSVALPPPTSLQGLKPSST